MSEPKSPEDEALAQPADLVTTDGEPPQIDTDTLQSEDSATNPQVQEMRLWAQYSNFQGPLPHPSTMEDYKKTGSDFPERIVAAWEAETQHRRELEKGDQELQMRPFELAAAGQKMAYSLAIGVFLGGLTLSLLDKPGYGFSMIIAEIAALVFAFSKVGRIDRRSSPSDQGGAVSKKGEPPAYS